MTKTNRQANKARAEKLSITINGYKARIKQEIKAKKESNNNIKKYKLLIKQAKTTAKLESL